MFFKNSFEQKTTKASREENGRIGSYPTPQDPLHEQATDIIPAEYNGEQDGPRDILAEAAAGIEKTGQITKSAREARRKGIRESNFCVGCKIIFERYDHMLVGWGLYAIGPLYIIASYIIRAVVSSSSRFFHS